MDERSRCRHDIEDSYEALGSSSARLSHSSSPNHSVATGVSGNCSSQSSWASLHKHSLSAPAHPYQLSRKTMHSSHLTDTHEEPDHWDHPLRPKRAGMHPKTEANQAAAVHSSDDSEAPSSTSMQTSEDSVDYHASRMHARRSSSSIPGSLQDMNNGSKGCCRDSSSSSSDSSLSDLPETGISTPASPEPPLPLPEPPCHRFTASIVNNSYEQYPSENVSKAAERARTEQEDREILESLAELAKAGGNAGKGELCKASVMWLLRDLLLILPPSSEARC